MRPAVASAKPCPCSAAAPFLLSIATPFGSMEVDPPYRGSVMRGAKTRWTRCSCFNPSKKPLDTAAAAIFRRTIPAESNAVASKPPRHSSLWAYRFCILVCSPMRRSSRFRSTDCMTGHWHITVCSASFMMATGITSERRKTSRLPRRPSTSRRAVLHDGPVGLHNSGRRLFCRHPCPGRNARHRRRSICTIGLPYFASQPPGLPCFEEGFLRVTDGRPLLLPELRPIGEADEDELLLSDMPSEIGAPLAPAIPSLRRQLLLARMICNQSPTTEKISLEHATRLAADLSKLLDQVQTEGLNFDKLDSIVPDRYAEHWQKTLELLSIITDRWPETLTAEGCLDPAERRNLLLQRQIEAWEAAPTDRRIIAAGSTGSIPAVAELLCCVAGLPNGTVVLPAFDTLMDDDAATAALDDQTHPQFGMLRLLKRMEISRHEIRDWPLEDHAEIQIKRIGLRRRLMSQVMRPAVTTDTWRELPKISENALAGFRALRLCWRSGRGEGHRFGFARVTPRRNTNSRAGNAGPKSCPACRRRTPALGHRDRRLRRPTACGDTARSSCNSSRKWSRRISPPYPPWRH